MTTYVDYAFYVDTYKGDEDMGPDGFDRLAMLASKQIDRFTFQRVVTIISDDDPADEVTAIKMATCAVIDELYKQEQEFHEGKAIKSESVGGHSVSYADNPDIKRSMLERQREAAQVWLEETHLMFPGFNTGEYGTSVQEI